MKVAIDVSPLYEANLTGIGLAIINLLDGLARLDSGNDYRLLYIGGLKSQAAERLELVKDRLPKQPNFAFRHHRFPSRLNLNLVREYLLPVNLFTGDFDLLHIPYHFAPLVRGRRTIHTVYDLTPVINPGWHTPRNAAEFRRSLRLITRRTDRVLAISESTGRDLVRLFDFPADRVTVIHLGVDRNRFFPLDEAGRAAARKRLAGCGIEGEYLLYVGTIEPRKNLARLLLAFDRVRRLGHREYRLVIAGRRGWLCEGFEKTLAGLPAAAREMIIRTEYFPKEGLTDLYNLATAFVYPSLYEGFGLPVLEAMACGCPVVTSNTSSLPELAGTAARLADPTEVESIAAAISDVLADPVERERMRREGFRQAERFSWEATARKTLAVYRDEAARQ